jgi:hypothetical protein
MAGMTRCTAEIEEKLMPQPTEITDALKLLRLGDLRSDAARAVRERILEDAA